METYKHNTLSAFSNKMARPIELEGKWFVGLVDLHCNSTKDAKKPLVTLMCVYADFLAPQLVGNSELQYLRIIPVKNFHQNIQIHQYKNPQYCPIIGSYIESISIILADIHGRRIDFKDADWPTYMLLHFTKTMK